MITEGLIVLLGSIVTLLLNTLPTLTAIPSGIANAINLVTPILGQVNSVVPIDQAMAALSLYLTIQIAIFGFRLFEWVWSKIFPTGQMRIPL